MEREIQWFLDRVGKDIRYVGSEGGRSIEILDESHANNLCECQSEGYRFKDA